MRVYEMFTDPTTYMKSIDENPRFARMVAVNAAGYLFVILIMWIFNAEEIFMMSEVPLDLENAAVLNNYRILSVLTTFMTFMFVPLIKAFFINIQMPLYKKDTAYLKTVCITLHAMIVLVAGEIIYLVPRILLGDITFAFSFEQVLGAYLSEPLSIIFAYFDIFTIGFQILMILGIKAITGLSAGKSAQIVLLPVAIMLALAII